MMITVAYALGVAWGYRWMALALLLFWFGQAETWPWTLVQIAADIMLVSLFAMVCRYARQELAMRCGRMPGGVSLYTGGTR